MRFRTLALALALACAATGTVEAKQKSSHTRKTKRTIKPRKAKGRKNTRHA